MEISETQFRRICLALPRQRGNVKVSNLQFLNALLYIIEHDCDWRSLPEHFGSWHAIYTRMNRWSKNGVLDQVFEILQREKIVRIAIEPAGADCNTFKVVSTFDRASDQVASTATSVPDGRPRFIWLPRMLERN